jgi:hypothetical protein
MTKLRVGFFRSRLTDMAPVRIKVSIARWASAGKLYKIGSL